MKRFSKFSDEQLVTMYAQGNDAAFDEILSRYQDKVFNYIYYLVHDQSIADDIFQDTFTKAILTMRAGRYNDTGKFGAWISRIAHNMVIDHFRASNAESFIANTLDEKGLLNTMRLSTNSIESFFINKQTREEVRGYIDRLSPPQREIMYMRFFQDLSFKEIADLTGVSINTSLGRMRYALVNIKKLMASDGFLDS